MLRSFLELLVDVAGLLFIGFLFMFAGFSMGRHPRGEIRGNETPAAERLRDNESPHAEGQEPRRAATAQCREIPPRQHLWNSIRP